MIGKMSVKNSFILTFRENLSTPNHLLGVSKENLWVDFYNNAELKSCMSSQKIKKCRDNLLRNDKFFIYLSSARREFEEIEDAIIVTLPANKTTEERTQLGFSEYPNGNTWWFCFRNSSIFNGDRKMREIRAYEEERRTNIGLGYLESIERFEEKMKSCGIKVMGGIQRKISKQRNRIQLIERNKKQILLPEEDV